MITGHFGLAAGVKKLVPRLPLLGFGLWNLPILSGLVELALALGGAYSYYQGTTRLKSLPHRARIASVVTGAMLLLLFVTNVLGL